MDMFAIESTAEEITESCGFLRKKVFYLQCGLDGIPNLCVWVILWLLLLPPVTLAFQITYASYPNPIIYGMESHRCYAVCIEIHPKIGPNSVQPQYHWVEKRHYRYIWCFSVGFIRHCKHSPSYISY